jgi:hypothetical protein
MLSGDVNGVEDVLATVEECIAEANEINEAISQPLAGMMADNDDDIEAMYQELLEQQEDEEQVEDERMHSLRHWFFFLIEFLF